jgi:2-iminobutanoate/2-iminopropanoate deaminase
MEVAKIRIGNAFDVERSRGIASVPAAVANGIVYTYGITAIDAETGLVVPGSSEEQTRTILRNLDLILRRAGSQLALTVCTTVYLRDIDGDYAGFNKAFNEVFASNPVPRTVVQATMRSPHARVQIQIVAVQGASDS